MTTLRIGKNILLFENGKVVLRKTNKSKLTIAFWTFLLLLTIFVTIFFILKDNQPLRWPPDIEGRIILPFVIGGVIFLIFRILRSAVNDGKEYVIAQEHDRIIVNRKLFAAVSQTVIAVKEKVGHKGIGIAYEVQLRYKRKKLVLSFGNRLGEATEVASFIGSRFGLQTEEVSGS